MRRSVAQTVRELPIFIYGFLSKTPFDMGLEGYSANYR